MTQTEKFMDSDDDLISSAGLDKKNVKWTLFTRALMPWLAVSSIFILNYFYLVPIYKEIYLVLFLYLALVYTANFFIYRAKDQRTVNDIYFFSTAIVFFLFIIIIHYLGGVEWIGFVFYFSAIVATGLIFTPKRGIFLTATACVLYLGLVIAEYGGIIPHKKPLFFELKPGLYGDFWYVLVTGIIMPLITFVSVGYITSKFSLLLKKEKEKSQHLYRLTKASGDIIINNMADGLLVLDHNNQVIRANSSAKTYLNLLDDYEGKSLSQISKMPINWNMEENIKTVTAGNISRYRIAVGDPPQRILESQITYVKKDDNSVNTIMILRDVSPPWGVVYDSKTKLPVPLAVVRMFNASTDKLLESKVTDQAGRFNFLPGPGNYYLTVTKDNYAFPSADRNFYQGEDFQIMEKGIMVNFKILIDPK
ncbi:hypothetical protein C4569_01330 [Candidatus Parcubacteria bacterium]|nr:MAG: hypothetical protein C4569_01330 [Candidatus Parcubacteria bacterium]